MSRYLLFISFVIALTSCQVYRNNSRELFERNAPSRIVNSDIGSKSIQLHECWTQDKATELLPLENPKYFYTIQNNLDESTIEVCLAENIHHDYASVH